MMTIAAILSSIPIIIPAQAPIPQVKLENPQSGTPDGPWYAIAVDGDTLIAGAPYADANNLLDSGSARIFRRDGAGGWTLEAFLTAEIPMSTDLFGWSVAISDDTALVGSINDDDRGFDSGAVYVFTRLGGVWTQQAKLKAADAMRDDQFGISVSLDGDTALIGAYLDDDGGIDSGAVYIFTRTGGVWTQQAKLRAADAAVGDRFGISVSLSGDTALIGAIWDHDGGSFSGSAYVFTRSGGVWTQQAKLNANDAAAGDEFGFSVSLDGDTALIGAYLDNDGGPKSGSAYIFTRSGGVWTQQAKINAADTAAGDEFGFSVTLSNGTAVVAAPFTHVDGGNSGAAYVFTSQDGIWRQQSKLIGPPGYSSFYDWFGSSVSLSGDTALIGAYRDFTAYIFTRRGGVWTQQAKLRADDATGGFGVSVSLSGDTALVGASEDDDGGLGSGSAYVFTRSGGVWSQQAKLRADDATALDEFGVSVSLSGDTALIGAYRDHDGGTFFSGSAYIFTRTGGVWSQQFKLRAADAAADDQFGISVSLSGDTALIGAHRDDDGVNDSGSAYVFTRTGGVWTQQAKLKAADAAADDRFGSSVSLSGDTALIGAYQDDDGGSISGSAYVFTRTGSVWTQQAKLSANDATAGAFFGVSVALNGDTALIGASHDDYDGSNSGSAYIFTRSGGVWTQQVKLRADDAVFFDHFGASVSLDGRYALSGAPLNDNPELDSGAAYMFDLGGPNTYPVIFLIDGSSSATLTGEKIQTVIEGANATPVTAVTPAGYVFVGWTIGGSPFSTENPLTVTNVRRNMTITAVFESLLVRSLREYLLGVHNDPTGLDFNNDGAVDVADLAAALMD